MRAALRPRLGKSSAAKPNQRVDERDRSQETAGLLPDHQHAAGVETEPAVVAMMEEQAGFLRLVEQRHAVVAKLQSRGVQTRGQEVASHVLGVGHQRQGGLNGPREQVVVGKATNRPLRVRTGPALESSREIHRRHRALRHARDQNLVLGAIDDLDLVGEGAVAVVELHAREHPFIRRFNGGHEDLIERQTVVVQLVLGEAQREERAAKQVRPRSIPIAPSTVFKVFNGSSTRKET